MKKTITLYSLDETQYPNIEIEVEVIESTSAKIKDLYEGKPFHAIKRAIVQARPAKAGEVVDTRPRVEVNGKIYTFTETTKTISKAEEQNGAMIVTNPDGEEYVIKSTVAFNDKYEKVEGGYIAIDGVKKFVRSNGNYSIQTSWGEEQIVLKGSYFCVQNKDDIYGITNTALDSTYTSDPNVIKLVEAEVHKIIDSRTSTDTI